MSTVTITTESLWTRVGNRLSNWGQKIKAAGSKVVGWIKRAATWLWSAKPTQWVITKTKFVAAWVWSYARTPIVWVLAPIAAILFAPKAVAVMLALVLVAVGVLAFFAWRMYRHFEEIGSLEELQDMVDQITDTVTEDQFGKSVEIVDLLDPDESIEDRFGYLDEQQEDAKAHGNKGLFSELTGRLFVLAVRNGGNSKLKKDASVAAIYRACKSKALADYPNFEWDLNRMYRGTQAEAKRLKDITRMKAEQANLATV